VEQTAFVDLDEILQTKGSKGLQVAFLFLNNKTINVLLCRNFFSPQTFLKLRLNFVKPIKHKSKESK